MTDSDLLLPLDSTQRAIARELFTHARDLPIISPHGHVDPWLIADDRPFPDPAQLLVVPDHYVTRMLYSQGATPEELGVRRTDGAPVQTDGRTIWRRVASNWHLFRGTPSRLWLELELRDVFGIAAVPSAANADELYDALAARLAEPAFTPRALFERFNLEVLATTESTLDDLAGHAKLAADGWGGRVVTTFRPDDVVDPQFPGWRARLDRLAEATGIDTGTFAGYLAAIEARRAVFVAAGARSTDHGHPTALTLDLTAGEAEALYQRLRSGVDPADAEAFRGHLLLHMARLSVEDGLVMQLHPGAVRDHNRALHAGHGRDVGGDIPQATEYTHALRPLLDRFGNDPRLRLVLYTLDETAFSREIAPLAGGYAAVFVGAPWWFLDTPDGLRRFREAVTDTAGFYNTAGFVDDTRAFCSIPVRHQVARRVDAGYLARLVADGQLSLDEAAQTIADLAYHLPKRVFRLDR